MDLHARRRTSRGRQVPRQAEPGAIYEQSTLLFDLVPSPSQPAESGAIAAPPKPLASSAILYTVRQLIVELRQHVEGAYTGILNVEGEISNCRPAASGHMYFTLKDGDAQLAVVLFRRNAQLLGFKPKDGLAVEVRGRISVYETRGQLQLIAESLRPRGTGALQLAFEQLRDLLRHEGLFDRPRKPLPPFPHCIGIVTSRNGAAIRDMIQVIQRRHGKLNLLVYPAVMQGPQCAISVARGVRWFNRNAGRVGLIVIARGGGSFEDLSGFNDEKLARVIVASALPVVTAIGHEIDHTIADYVADLRAPTPSAAAELVTGAQHDIEERVLSLARRGRRAAEFQLMRVGQRLQRLSAEQVLARVHDSIGRREQCIDELRFRLNARITGLERKYATRTRILEAQLRKYDPSAQLSHASRRLTAASAKLATLKDDFLVLASRRSEAASLRLHALSPLAVLNRGYAIVYLESTEQETILRHPDDTRPGQTIRARLAHGSVRAVIMEATHL